MEGWRIYIFSLFISLASQSLTAHTCRRCWLKGLHWFGLWFMQKTQYRKMLLIRLSFIKKRQSLTPSNSITCRVCAMFTSHIECFWLFAQPCSLIYTASTELVKSFNGPFPSTLQYFGRCPGPKAEVHIKTLSVRLIKQMRFPLNGVPVVKRRTCMIYSWRCLFPVAFVENMMERMTALLLKRVEWLRAV